jgi:tetratricopeptide (TPR) repeat protein
MLIHRSLAATTLVAFGLAGPAALAVESDPLPVPADTVRAEAVRSYNGGVELLLGRNYAQAQARFEAALKLDESIAEAHNNLAFSLRMQGAHNFALSLRHYNRAIELSPGWRRPTCTAACCSRRSATSRGPVRAMRGFSSSTPNSPPGSKPRYWAAAATSAPASQDSMSDAIDRGFDAHAAWRKLKDRGRRR